MTEFERLRKLFTRYIAHVKNCEGVDFIIDGHHHEEESFSAEEWKELENIANAKGDTDHALS